MPVHDFDPPDRFVAGTVGPPGQRVFFLQALAGRRVVSVSCEKEQVAVLAERVDDVLDQFAGDAAGAGADDNEPLATPIEDEFRVATLSLAWDPAREVVVIEAFDSDLPEATEWLTGEAGDDPGEAGDDPGEAGGDPGEGGAPGGPTGTGGEQAPATGTGQGEEPVLRHSVRVVLSPPQARSFVRRARALVSAGRPPCPFCGGPLDPTGHVCPRANGYKR